MMALPDSGLRPKISSALHASRARSWSHALITDQDDFLFPEVEKAAIPADVLDGLCLTRLGLGVCIAAAGTM
jgi:hypothetical protein